MALDPNTYAQTVQLALQDTGLIIGADDSDNLVVLRGEIDSEIQSVSFDTDSRVLTIETSYRNYAVTIPGGAAAGNTTYHLEWDSSTRVLTLVGSDGTRDSETIAEYDDTNINARVDSERAERIARDSELQAEIDALPDSDTTYHLDNSSGPVVTLTGSDGSTSNHTVTGVTPGHFDSETIIHSTETWISGDSEIATTAAIDQRIHDLSELKHFNLIIQRNYATNQDWDTGEQVYVSGAAFHPQSLVAYQPNITQYTTNNRIRFVFNDVAQLNAYVAEWIIVGRRFARGANREAEQYIQQVFSYNNETIEDTFPLPNYRGLPYLDVQLTTTVNTAWQGIGGGISFVYFYDDTDESHGVFEYTSGTENNNAMTTNADWTLIHTYDTDSLRKLIAQNTSRINANTTQIEANRDNITIERNARIAGDSDLAASVNAINLDLNNKINSERTARIAGDSDLQAQIDALPDSDTTYQFTSYDSETERLGFRVHPSVGDSEFVSVVGPESINPHMLRGYSNIEPVDERYTALFGIDGDNNFHDVDMLWTQSGNERDLYLFRNRSGDDKEGRVLFSTNVNNNYAQDGLVISEDHHISHVKPATPTTRIDLDNLTTHTTAKTIYDFDSEWVPAATLGRNGDTEEPITGKFLRGDNTWQDVNDSDTTVDMFSSGVNRGAMRTATLDSDIVTVQTETYVAPVTPVAARDSEINPGGTVTGRTFFGPTNNNRPTNVTPAFGANTYVMQVGNSAVDADFDSDTTYDFDLTLSGTNYRASFLGSAVTVHTQAFGSRYASVDSDAITWNTGQFLGVTYSGVFPPGSTVIHTGANVAKVTRFFPAIPQVTQVGERFELATKAYVDSRPGGSGSDSELVFSTRASFSNPTRSNALVVTGGEYDSEILFQGGRRIELNADNNNNVFDRTLDIIPGSMDASTFQGSSLYTALPNGTAGQVLASLGNGGFEWTTTADSDTTYTLSVHGTQIALRDNITGVVQSGSIVIEDSESGVAMLDSDHNTQGSLEFVIDSDSDIIYLQSSNYEPAHSGRAATNASDTVLTPIITGNGQIWGPTASNPPLLEPQNGATPPATTTWYVRVADAFTDAYLNALIAEGNDIAIRIQTLSPAQLYRGQIAILNVERWVGQVGNATWGGQVFLTFDNSHVTWSTTNTGSQTQVPGSFTGTPAQNYNVSEAGGAVITENQVTNGSAAIPATGQVGLKLAVASTDFARNQRGTTYGVFDTDSDGLVPSPTDSEANISHVLSGAGTWVNLPAGAAANIQLGQSALFYSLGEIGPVAGSNDDYAFNTPTLQAGDPLAQLSLQSNSTGIIFNTEAGNVWRHRSITDTDYERITWDSEELRQFVNDSELRMTDSADSELGPISRVQLLSDSDLRVRTDNFAATIPAGDYSQVTLQPSGQGTVSLLVSGTNDYTLTVSSIGGQQNLVEEINNAGIDDYEITLVSGANTYVGTFSDPNIDHAPGNIGPFTISYANVEWSLVPPNATYTNVTLRIREATIAQVGGTIDLVSKAESQRYADSEIGSLRVHSVLEEREYRNSLVLETPNRPAFPGSEASFSMDLFGVSGSGTFSTSFQGYYLDTDGGLSTHTYTYSGNRSGVDAATGFEAFLNLHPNDFANVVRVNANVSWNMARPGYVYGYSAEPNTGSFGHEYHVVSHGADSEAATYYDRVLSTWTEEAPDDSEIAALRANITNLNRQVVNEIAGIPVEITRGPRDFRSIRYNNNRMIIETLPEDSEIWTQITAGFTDPETLTPGGNFTARFRMTVEEWDTDQSYNQFSSSELQVNYLSDTTFTFDDATDTLTIVLGADSRNQIREGTSIVTRSTFTTIDDGYYTELTLYDNTVYSHVVLDASNFTELGEQNFAYSALDTSYVIRPAITQDADSDIYLGFFPPADSSINYLNSDGVSQGRVAQLRQLANNNLSLQASDDSELDVVVTQTYVENVINPEHLLNFLRWNQTFSRNFYTGGNRDSDVDLKVVRVRQNQVVTGYVGFYNRTDYSGENLLTSKAWYQGSSLTDSDSVPTLVGNAAPVAQTNSQTTTDGTVVITAVGQLLRNQDGSVYRVATYNANGLGTTYVAISPTITQNYNRDASGNLIDKTTT